MPFEFQFIKMVFVEASKFRSQLTEGSDQLDLRRQQVNDKTEACLLRENETLFAFGEGLGQRVPYHQQVCNQLVPAISGESQIPVSEGSIERPAYHITPLQGVFCGGNDKISKRHQRSGLIAPKPAFFDEFIAQTTESKGVFVITEARSSDDGKPHIGEGRRVRVAMLEAQKHHPAKKKRRQFLIEEHCWRHNLGQNVHGLQAFRISHNGQVQEVLDLTSSNQLPDSVILAVDFIDRRM